MQAQCLLQCALTHAPASPPLRLALCATAALLGDSELALAQVQTLQVRQVQLDSLSHHVLPALAAAADCPAAGGFMRQVRGQCSLHMHACTAAATSMSMNPPASLLRQASACRDNAPPGGFECY